LILLKKRFMQPHISTYVLEQIKENAALKQGALIRIAQVIATEESKASCNLRWLNKATEMQRGLAVEVGALEWVLSLVS
jgi:hypothetical protein